MTEAECNRVAEGVRWQERQTRKVVYEREKVLMAIRAKKNPCSLCEKKRIEGIYQEEEAKKWWYNGLTKGQQIMATIRGDYP